jgi:hypothetical protein
MPTIAGELGRIGDTTVILQSLAGMSWLTGVPVEVELAR